MEKLCPDRVAWKFKIVLGSTLPHKLDGCQGALIDKLSVSSLKLIPNIDGIHEDKMA